MLSKLQAHMNQSEDVSVLKFYPDKTRTEMNYVYYKLKAKLYI